MAQKQIRITKNELMLAQRSVAGDEGHAPPLETQRYLIHRLKQAGVPILGELFFIDVQHGELRIKKALDGGWHITWRG